MTENDAAIARQSNPESTTMRKDYGLPLHGKGWKECHEQVPWNLAGGRRHYKRQAIAARRIWLFRESVPVKESRDKESGLVVLKDDWRLEYCLIRLVAQSREMHRQGR